MREYDKQKLANLTDEQKQKRKDADSAYKKRRPKTEAILISQRAATKKHRAKKIETMTPDELLCYQAKKREYMQSYVMTEDQKRRSLQATSAWAKANPERVSNNKKEWMKKNPDAYRIYAQNRRARKRAQAGRVSHDIVDRLMRLQKGRCAGCKDVLGELRELDHISPLAKGGEHDDLNLQLLCRTCNRSKGTRHPIDFMQLMGNLI